MLLGEGRKVGFSSFGASYVKRYLPLGFKINVTPHLDPLPAKNLCGERKF